MNSDLSLYFDFTIDSQILVDHKKCLFKALYTEQKIKFDQNREHLVLKHIFNYCTCNKQFIEKGVLNTFYIRF